MGEIWKGLLEPIWPGIGFVAGALTLGFYLYRGRTRLAALRAGSVLVASVKGFGLGVLFGLIVWLMHRAWTPGTIAVVPLAILSVGVLVWLTVSAIVVANCLGKDADAEMARVPILMLAAIMGGALSLAALF